MEWFQVSFNQQNIELDVNPPGGDGWKAEIYWKDIIRVCFIPKDFLLTDELYIFTSLRPESYLIPTEAKGAMELWYEIISKNLFDAQLAIRVATASEGLFCWPEGEIK